MNDFSRLVGIDVPIVLGPFGGVSSVALAAAVSNAGGLGSIGLYGYAPDRIRATAAALGSATSRPINLNLWWPVGDEVESDAVDWQTEYDAVAPIYADMGIQVPQQPASFMPALADQIAAVLEARPRVVSFVFGVPDSATIRAFHDADTLVIGTATNVPEAILLANAGVDAIVATGSEAGGHRVTFVGRAEDSLNGIFTLVPQIVDEVDVPVIAAGGIADRRGVAAAMALGASAVQVGTAFLATQESAAPPEHRAAIRNVAQTGTRLTRAMSGRLARGIENEAMRVLEAQGSPTFPARNWLTGGFRTEAAKRNDAEHLSLWAGQGAPLANGETAAEVFAELAAGFAER